MQDINDKYCEFSMKDAEKIARKINKIEDPKIIDFASDIIIKHFTAFNDNNEFCFNNNENQIEIYKENNLKYSKNQKKKLLKLKKKLII